VKERKHHASINGAVYGVKILTKEGF